MESPFAFTKRGFVPIYQVLGEVQAGDFSAPGKTAPLVLGEADKQMAEAHHPRERQL